MIQKNDKRKLWSTEKKVSDYLKTTDGVSLKELNLLEGFYKWLENGKTKPNEKEPSIVSVRWNFCILDMEDFTNEYGLGGIVCRTVPDKNHIGTTNVCYLDGEEVEYGQFICHDTKTRHTWISDWDAADPDADEREYEFLKEKYKDFDRYVELKEKFDSKSSSITRDMIDFDVKMWRKCLDELNRRGANVCTNGKD